MKKFIKGHRFLAGLLSVFISVFLVSIIVYAATTIGTNVTTEGYATSTVGVYSQGVLDIGGNALIRGKATTTTAFAVGVGTINSLDMTGGDLYVQGDAEIDGFASTTSALNTQGTLHAGGNVTIGGKTTTTDYIYLPRINFQQGVVTSTAPNIGECFMPKNEFVCWDGVAWQYAW